MKGIHNNYPPEGLLFYFFSLVPFFFGRIVNGELFTKEEMTIRKINLYIILKKKKVKVIIV